MANEQKGSFDKKEIYKSLRDIALFLEGLKMGKGDIIPLGTRDLDALWAALQHFESEK